MPKIINYWKAIKDCLFFTEIYKKKKGKGASVKKIKKFLTSMLLGLIAFSSMLTVPITAKSAKVSMQISVTGDGEVKVECDDFEYLITKDDGFVHDVQMGTKLTFTATEKNEKFKNVTVNQNETDVTQVSDGVYTMIYTANTDSAIVFNFAGRKVTASTENETDITESTKPTTQAQEKVNSNKVIEESTTDTSEEIDENIESKGKLIIDEADVNEKMILTEEEQSIIEDYKAGNKNKDEYIVARKAIVEKINAFDYVDDNYFINDNYFSDFTTMTTLIYLKAGILIDPDYRFNDEMQIMPMSLDSPQVTSFYNSSIVTFADSVGNSVVMDGGYWLVDGHVAFCSNAKQSPPKKGAKLKKSVLSSNANLRKALYYGYNGPDDRLSKSLSKDKAIVVTNELASNAKSGLTFCSIHGAGYVVKDHYSWIYDLPNPPSNFQVYTADGIDYGSNSLGNNIVNQTMAYWILQEKGKLQIKKESANTEMTTGNNCYSLEGAEYGVYSDSSAKTKVATLKTGVDGWSNTVSLDAGTYYVKEITAPKGFELSSDVVTATVKPDETTKLSNGKFVDTPKNDPIRILLNKIDADTGNADPSGRGTLADAQFTIKFYKGDYVDPATQGKSPDKTWVLKTDSDGYTQLSDSYKVSGDAFYLEDGKVTLPLGTVTIQETKAPIGYHLNPAINVRKIKLGSTGKVEAYNVPIIKENALKLNISKVQENSNVQISGARFRHTRPNGAVEELETNGNGSISMVGLENGVHTLKESYVKDGYDLNPTEIRFEVKTNGVITMLTDLSGTGVSYGTDSNGNGSIKVEDKVTTYSLEIPKVNNHGKSLDGAEFTLYSDKACTNVIDKKVTENGKLLFTGIKDRTHYYFKETKAPTGYRIPVDSDGNVHVYDVYAESTPQNGVFDFYVDGTKYTVDQTTGAIHLAGDAGNRIVSVQITNAVGLQLPNTGSSLTIILIFIGVLLMGGVLVLSYKNKNNKNNKKGKIEGKENE